MKRFLNRVMSAGLLLATCSMAQALGLGVIKTQSALNEPLRAEIALLDLGELDPQQLNVNLGDNEAYQKRWLTRNDIHRDIQVKVDWQRAGGPVLVLSSQRFVKEPVLDLVLQLSWPQGRLERSYSVLLDHR